MPSGDALMGVGFPAHQADLLGGNPSIVNGTGTAQVGAGKVLTKNVELNTSGGQTAVIIPNGDICQPYFFTNPDATTGLVFPPVGHTMNGTLNASVSVAQNKSAIVWQYKPGFWTSILTA
jgi:hypothetical protein